MTRMKYSKEVVVAVVVVEDFDAAVANLPMGHWLALEEVETVQEQTGFEFKEFLLDLVSLFVYIVD